MKNTKRLLALVMALTLVMLSVFSAFSAKEPEPVNFTILGDSIASGYGLEDYLDSYGALISKDKRYDLTNPNRMKPMVEKFPRLTFIGGHFAGREFYREAAEEFRDCANLFADCSSSFLWMKEEDALHCIRTFTADRVMFGTDHPVFRPNFDLDYLFRLPLTPEEFEKILSGTAQKVFRFTAPWAK